MEQIFTFSAKALHNYYEEVIASDIPVEEKFEKIETAIRGMSYFDAKKQKEEEEQLSLLEEADDENKN